MKNKVLVKVMMPEMDLTFDIFIPVNELVWKIKKLIIKCVSDITCYPLDIKEEYYLVNKSNGNFYNNNDVVINTDIRNSTELILVSKV